MVKGYTHDFRHEKFSEIREVYLIPRKDLTMAGTQAAGSSVAGPTGPTKEQMMAKIQEL
jgi:hypothetical protein